MGCGCVRAGTRRDPRADGSALLRLAVTIVFDVAFENAIAVIVEISGAVQGAVEVNAGDDAPALFVVDILTLRDTAAVIRDRVGPPICIRIERRGHDLAPLGD